MPVPCTKPAPPRPPLPPRRVSPMQAREHGTRDECRAKQRERRGAGAGAHLLEAVGRGGQAGQDLQRMVAHVEIRHPHRLLFQQPQQHGDILRVPAEKLRVHADDLRLLQGPPPPADISQWTALPHSQCCKRNSTFACAIMFNLRCLLSICESQVTADCMKCARLVTRWASCRCVPAELAKRPRAR